MSEPTLLLVDDEQSILNALTRVLRKEPYRLLTAVSGEEALDILEKETVHVVGSDFRMPGKSGIELLREVKQRFPATVRVILSGYADGHVIVDSINVGEVYRFLPKPWNDDELVVALRQCFEQYELRSENERLLEQVRSQNEELREMNELLEMAVNQRTRSLQLSQEVLEKLPLPVLGLSPDGTIVLINAAVGQIVPPDNPMPLGMSLDEIFPEDVVETVTLSIAERESNTINQCTLNGQEFRIYIRMLQDDGDLRGCTLVLEAIYKDDYSYSFSSNTSAY
jgi:ActR/RegA family two-component response regulator